MFLAQWSDTNALTLAIDEDRFWRNPLGAESLEVLIHEAAHALNMHHGLNFRLEVERLAGVAANRMLIHHVEIIRKWSDLYGLV